MLVDRDAHRTYERMVMPIQKTREHVHRHAARFAVSKGTKITRSRCGASDSRIRAVRRTCRDGTPVAVG